MSGGKVYRRRSAFTLVELIVVLLIIGILAVVTVPYLGQVHKQTAFQSTHQSFTIIVEAAQRYYMEHGEWPADTPRGQLPTELQPYLRTRAFQATPAIGHTWDWNGPGTSADVHGYNVAIFYDLADSAEMRQFDREFDDGSLDTGVYRRQGPRLLRLLSE